VRSAKAVTPRSNLSRHPVKVRRIAAIAPALRRGGLGWYKSHIKVVQRYHHNCQKVANRRVEQTISCKDDDQRKEDEKPRAFFLDAHALGTMLTPHGRGRP
jgi:hypothetical protein